MLRIYDLKNQQMLTKPDFWKLTEGFVSFRGVSFVGSFKVIEQELLPRFQQVKLILGMEDRQTGQKMEQIFNVPRRVEELVNASDTFLQRIEAGSLQLKFTKQALFHSKYFLLENETQFIIFNGSMNLTKQAMTQNHELVWCYRGEKAVPQDQAIYQAHLALFKQNFEVDSTDYVNRKLIQQIKGKSRQEITAILTDHVAQETTTAITLQKEEITAITDQQQREKVVAPQWVKAVQAVYTAKGNKKRDQAAAQANAKVLYYQAFAQDEHRVIPENELYPVPMWTYDETEGQVLVQNPVTDRYEPLQASPLSRADLENFVNIIESFRTNKVRDESLQALSAFLYLMTAPLIWKIRQIYRESNFSRSADQVPLSMVLIGRGTTGKTLLVHDYFKPFTGDTSASVQYSEINNSTSARSDRAVAFLDHYLKSQRFISPMVIDELYENFLHSKVATNAIKQWSNTLEDIHNVNIFAMNHNASNKGINNLEEITKRVYYLSFESGWLPEDEQTIDYRILVNNVNDHLYKTVIYRLNQRLNHLSGEDESKLIKDYLSLTKEILSDLLAQYGLNHRLAPLLAKRYDYKQDQNKTIWRMLLAENNFKNVYFTAGDDQHFTVSKAIFNDLKSNLYQNNNETLDNYFNMLPREMGIGIVQNDIGMILDIDKFDQFIGEPLVRNYYQQAHKAEHQQDAVTRLIALQEAEAARRATEEAKRQEKYDQILAELAHHQTKKTGLFGRFFKRN